MTEEEKILQEMKQLQAQLIDKTNRLRLIRRNNVVMVSVAAAALGSTVSVTAVAATSSVPAVAPVAVTNIGLASKTGIIGIGIAGKAVCASVAVKLTLAAGAGGLVGLILGGVMSIAYYSRASRQANAEIEDVRAVTASADLKVVQPQFNR